jgi:TolB-like protein
MREFDRQRAISLVLGVDFCVSGPSAKFRLELLGPFRLFGPDGRRIELASKRGQALIAMLAVANGGERTRSWLQDRLWGSRQHLQAQASLRRELSNLRQAVNCFQVVLLHSDHSRVRLDIEQINIDARGKPDPGELFGEFLEGLDIVGEESLEDWLREQRQLIRRIADSHGSEHGLLPKAIIDMSKPVPGFSGRPAIAVLPLENQMGVGELGYLSDGISEELIERLSRLKWLPVIARSASFAYRGRTCGLAEIGSALGARYVLDGRIRRSDDCFELSLSMADVETGLTAWTHASRVPLQFTQAIVDDLIVEIVGVMDTKIDAAEKVRASRKPEGDLTVDDLIWRGRWHLHRFTREDATAAHKYFSEALSMAPNSPEALVQMTFFEARAIWSERKDEAKMRALRKLAQRAIVADSEDSRGYMYAGMAELWMRRPALALPLFERAVQLNPSLALAHAQIGSAHILAGNAAPAIEPLRLALRLSPNDEHAFYVLGELAIAHCMLGRWDSAIDHANQSLLRRVAYWYAHVTRINALVGKGNPVEARYALRQLRDVKPDFNLQFIDWLPFVESKWTEFLKSGLQSAGMT